MWKWTLFFLGLLSVVALLGFGGLAGAFAIIAQVLFFVLAAMLAVWAVAYTVQSS